jgi:hypothetical protein
MRQLEDKAKERKAQTLAVEILDKKGIKNPTRREKSGALFVARKLVND